MNNDTPISDDNGWKKLIHRLGISVENSVDFVRERFQQRIQSNQALKIVAFHGMGNEFACRLQGRVLECAHQPSDEPDSIWKNLQDNYRRFETDEVPGIGVRLDVGDQQYLVNTDDEGYFLFEFPCPQDKVVGPLTVLLSLPDFPEQHDQTPATLYFPHQKAAFGVISDIDDTVLVTQATSIVKMMRLTLLGSSKSRLPFGGVAEFYKALHAVVNPVFYVSSSPWNLFEFLDDFLRLNDIPAGPLMLRDFGIDKTKLVVGPHKTHKLAQIKTILDFYPQLPFILIGDSGQHDPEIYAQVVADYPGRILSIYIRDVSHTARDREVQTLADELREASVDMVLVADTLAAATHAAGKGYVNAETPDTIADALKNQLPEDEDIV